jgi:hypothetical protein
MTILDLTPRIHRPTIEQRIAQAVNRVAAWARCAI